MSTGRSVILAVGDVSLPAASAVRDARSWTVRATADLTEVGAHLAGGLTSSALVIADADSASIDELRAACQAAAESSPSLALGFLYGRGEAGLLAAARRLSAEPAVAPARSPQYLFGPPALGISLRGAHLVPSGELADSPQEIAQRLLEPSELTFLLGHANAMHLSVGGALLCRRSATSPGADELRVYPCFHGDPCYFGENREEVEVDIERLRARRIVSVSCFGASVIDEPFAAEYSIGEGLLRHAEVDAVVTSLRAATYSQADLAMLYYLCSAGLPMGTVANRLNRFRLSCGQPVEAICFGDPATRLEPHLEEVACVRSQDRLTIDPGASNGAARDLVAEIPDGPMPEEPLLLDETGDEVTAAVLDPAGRVYASLPEEWDGQSLHFRLADRREIADVGGSAKTLAGDLSFLDIYLTLLATATEGQDSVVEALQAVADLQEVLRSWPLVEQPVGLRLVAAEVDAVWEEVRAHLDAVGEKLSAAYLELMVEDDRTYLYPWDSRYETVATHPDAAPCAYCGHAIDEFSMRARLGTDTRSWGLCRSACAFVYDGDPALGRWLDVPERLAAGRGGTVTLATRNPYAVPVPVRGVGVLKHFQRGRSQPAASVRLELAPEQSGRLRLEIVPPPTFRPGTYHFCAALLVGAKLNFYRAQLQVAPGAQEP